MNQKDDFHFLINSFFKFFFDIKNRYKNSKNIGFIFQYKSDRIVSLKKLKLSMFLKFK